MYRFLSHQNHFSSLNTIFIICVRTESGQFLSDAFFLVSKINFAAQLKKKNNTFGLLSLMVGTRTDVEEVAVTLN